jgi:hypothetical protein
MQKETLQGVCSLNTIPSYLTGCSNLLNHDYRSTSELRESSGQNARDTDAFAIEKMSLNPLVIGSHNATDSTPSKKKFHHTASQHVPEEKRVTIKEITFDLHARIGTLKYATKNSGTNTSTKHISW